MAVELFEVVDGVLELHHEYLRGIPAFREILVRDSTPGKVNAYNELLYVHHCIGYGSPFSKLPVEERNNKAKINSHLPITWKPDRAVKNAIIAYDELQKAENPSEIVAQSLKEGLHMTAYIIKELTVKMQEQLITIERIQSNSDMAIPKERLLADINTLFGLSDKLPKAFANLDLIEQRVIKDRGQIQKVRGGHDKGMFEDPPQGI